MGTLGHFACAVVLFAGGVSPLILGGLVGCEAAPRVTDLRPDEAIRVALDPEERPNRRAEALAVVRDDLRADSLDRAQFRDVLKKMVWARSNPPQVRIAAIEALLADTQDLDDTRRMLRLMVPTESAAWQWDVIEYIGEVAAERGWTDLTPAFVASWSRSVPSISPERRVERAAIKRLHPDRTLEEVAFAVFAGEFDDTETQSAEVQRMFDQHRRAAWGVLCDLSAEPETDRRAPGRHMARRSTVEAADAIYSFLISTTPSEHEPREMVLLRRSAADFGAVPITREQLDWLERLAADQHSAFWREAARIVSTLGAEQRQGFALRHLSAVVWASRHESRWLEMGKDDLLDHLAERMRGDAHHPGGAVSRYDGTIRRARADMLWGDALLALIARRAAEQDSVIVELFAQADRDFDDKSTEYGGVIDTRSDGGFVALLYPPRPAQRMGDTQFVASPELIEAGTAALFHYHFHANSRTNMQYAGPSTADIEYARTFGRSCLVFTFIDPDRLNADYYTPDGVRIDLGTMRRP
mgnify:FL=1